MSANDNRLCSPNCAVCWRYRHAGHAIGWRHEDGSLLSATCHDCGERYERTAAPVSVPDGKDDHR